MDSNFENQTEKICSELVKQNGLAYEIPDVYVKELDSILCETIFHDFICINSYINSLYVSIDDISYFSNFLIDVFKKTFMREYCIERYYPLMDLVEHDHGCNKLIRMENDRIIKRISLPWIKFVLYNRDNKYHFLFNVTEKRKATEEETVYIQYLMNQYLKKKKEHDTLIEIEKKKNLQNIAKLWF